MNAQVAHAHEASLIVTQVSALARKLDIEGDANKLFQVLKATAFRGDATNEQLVALLIVSKQHGLNPWLKEIYAFPDKNNSIVPVVGVDGWTRIINSHPQFDGLEFEQDADKCTCIIFRKDRSHPIKVTEYMSECARPTQPWKSHPMRMLRHKALIQASRLAFGFSGIYDTDEAERIRESETQTVHQVAPVADLMPKPKAEPKVEDPIEDAVVVEDEPETTYEAVIDLDPSMLKALEAKVRQAGKTIDDVIAEFAPITKDNITEVLKSLQ